MGRCIARSPGLDADADDRQGEETRAEGHVLMDEGIRDTIERMVEMKMVLKS